MKASELTILGFVRLQESVNDTELTGGYTSDLLSDVMGNMEEGQVLITIQAHKNTIAVASLAGAAAIVFCHGRKPSPEVVNDATREGIALFSSADNQFDTTCKVSAALQ